MDFSVLMSIYFKEKAVYFNRAMQSVFDDQTLKPSEILLVQDGLLTEELSKEIRKWQHRLGDVLKIIELEKNLGIGDALNIGLANCHHDLIARMDTDDVSHPDRFKIQVKYMMDNIDCDLLGSSVKEFDDNPDFVWKQYAKKNCWQGKCKLNPYINSYFVYRIYQQSIIRENKIVKWQV